MFTHLPHSTNASLEETVKAVQDQQERHEQQLQSQRQSIAELTAKLEAALEAFQEPRPRQSAMNLLNELTETDQSTGKPLDRGLSQYKAGESMICALEAAESMVSRYEDNDTPEYQLEQSMWDAMLLLFFGNVSLPDKVLLSIGFVLNLGIQVLLLVVLWWDMVDTTAYGTNKVDEMVKWRVLVGHQDEMFDEIQGKPLIQKLCSQELWSYEQDQFEEMYNYLYKPVAGATLSGVALILWVLSSMIEYRRIVEQGLAIWRLPLMRAGSFFHVREAQEELEIIGARPLVRIFIVLLLLVPRFVVLGILCVGGCKYLAETASLPDLVLNAMALAFILDVDELLCQVLLPCRLRKKIDQIQPMPCGDKGGKGNFLGFSKTDWLRYLITVGMVLMGFFVYLEPFMTNVEAAATALCGGQQDFSYVGGIQSTPTVTLMNSSTYSSSCSIADKNAHMSSFYGIAANQTLFRAQTSSVDWTVRKTELVLGYAYKGCAAGLVSDAKGTCGPVPETLRAVLPSSVTPGANADPGVCPTLEVSSGASACNGVAAPSACLWTWMTYRCEQDTPWPGHIYNQACSTDLRSSCEAWRYELQREHPSENCYLADMCNGPNYDCVGSYADLEIHVLNTTTFSNNETLVWESVRQSIFEAINVSTLLDSQVELQERVGLGFTYFRYVFVRRLPSTMFPHTVAERNATVLQLANQKIAAATGLNETLSEVVLGSASLYLEDRYSMVRNQVTGVTSVTSVGAPSPPGGDMGSTQGGQGGSGGNDPLASGGGGGGSFSGGTASPSPSGSWSGSAGSGGPTPSPAPTGSGSGSGPSGSGGSTPSPAPGDGGSGQPPTR